MNQYFLKMPQAFLLVPQISEQSGMTFFAQFLCTSITVEASKMITVKGYAVESELYPSTTVAEKTWRASG